jgi:predicted nucleic acid-binding protein
MGCVGILERGYGRKLVADLRKAYLSLLAQNIRIDREILNQSLATQRLPAI